MSESIDSNVQIEDLRDHPEETVAALRTILAGGARMIPDAKRRDLYEVESSSLVYYIHVSPVTGNVLLLATWPNESVPAGTGQFA